MKITVIGGGNIGTLMAADMAEKGHQVTMYTSKPEKWSESITVLDSDDNLLRTGNLYAIKSDIGEAVKDAEIIWIAMPAMLFSSLADKLYDAVKPGQMIGVVPGSGGAEFAFHKLIDKGCTLFGLQRVHSIARLKEYGHSVYELGRKSELQIGSIPAERAEKICEIVQGFFDIPCRALPNYLCVTLTPSNPILHTTRLYSMFKDYKNGMTYPKNILFYEEWSDFASEMLIACDAELQQLCSAIPLELKDVVSLRVYYESQTVAAMTEKISGITAFKGITSPMKETENGWIPDFSSRYFTADFSYGLKIIKDIAELFGVLIPNIGTVWNWYKQTNPNCVNKCFVENFNTDAFTGIYR
ncbi:MAG: NAD/NADP octopine/nopaline dehydrogenase family protein [Ruminococcus sp.]|jgi:hypothetical protein|nr:NAD/NADP octopine/nopaline dehydrogenase family protein [Ruminococcus sp.]